MNQITNSPAKEAMRFQNESYARGKESQIKQKLGTEIVQIRDKLRSDTNIIRTKLREDVARVDEKKDTGSCLLPVVIGFLCFMGFIYGVLHKNAEIGLIVAIVIYISYRIWRKSWYAKQDTRKRQLEIAAETEIERMEAEAEVKIRRLEADANSDIQKLYDEADRQTMQQIDAYNNEVKQYSKRILQKADAIASMVQHNTDMFQRMVSHADAGTNMRFVESDFTYKVTMTGIMYSFQSRYTNPQDDYVFDKQRFRNLNSNTECEGLAQALAKLTMKRMMSLYPPNSLHITVSHIDAEVTMHYKAANKNFIAARDIF